MLSVVTSQEIYADIQGPMPSIYDVHAEGVGVRLRWPHADREGVSY